MKKFAFLPLALLAASAAAVLVAFKLPDATLVEKRTAAEPGFEAYLAQFPLQQLPFRLGEAELMPAPTADADPVGAARNRQFDNGYLDRQSTVFQSERFSRIPIRNEPLARVETPTHHAVIIARRRSFSGPYAAYSAVVFDRAGRLTGIYTVANVRPRQLTTCAIDEQLRATLREFEREDDEQAFIFKSETVADLTAPNQSRSEDLPVQNKKAGKTTGARAR